MHNPCLSSLKHDGNTLAEYAIIIGLIGVASIGALMVLGQSMNGHYDNLSQGNSAQAMQAMSHMDFTVPSVSQGQPQSSGPGTKGNQAPYNVGNDSFQLSDTSSSGTNVTSIEGNFNAVLGQGVQTAKTMEKLASQVKDSNLKAWYRKTSDMVFKLASSQAAYELGINPNTAYLTSMMPQGGQGKVTTADAIFSIDEWQDQLEEQFEELEDNHTASAQEIQQAWALLSAVVKTNSARYSGIIQATNTSGAQLYDPNVNQVKKAAEIALQTGILPSDEAVTTSVINGVEMDKNASDPYWRYR